MKQYPFATETRRHREILSRNFVVLSVPLCLCGEGFSK